MFDGVQTSGTSIGILSCGWPSLRFSGLADGANSARARMASMLMWIVLGLVGWALGFLFVMILMRMAGNEDRAARHEEKLLDPFSDVSITQTGAG
jgi:hypothetical protein